MFAKVFASLWDGTLADHWEFWSVFVFMLAHSDARGVVDMTPQAISRRSCIPLDKVEAALAHLSAPDPRSRTAAEGGRRIVLLDDHRDWGWRIVNYERYRNTRDEESRREQVRESTRRWRDSRTPGEQSVNTGEHAVNSVNIGEHPVNMVNIGEHSVNTVNTGEPKQKQKQKEKKIEPAGFESYLPAIAEAIDNSPDPDTARRLARYLHDSGTTETTDILAVLDHWTANHRTIGKPLAYYAAERPARSAIVMQHRMDAEMARHQLVKRAGHA